MTAALCGHPRVDGRPCRAAVRVAGARCSLHQDGRVVDERRRDLLVRRLQGRQQAIVDAQLDIAQIRRELARLDARLAPTQEAAE